MILLVGSPGSVGWAYLANSRRARTTRLTPTTIRTTPTAMMAGVKNPRGIGIGITRCNAIATRKGMPKTTSKICHHRLCALPSAILLNPSHINYMLSNAVYIIELSDWGHQCQQLTSLAYPLRSMPNLPASPVCSSELLASFC
ncbi:MAG TPA: hypothetical protein VK856_13510 [Anaerolineaceae bacterium]|nr:hypothetical protein [Anaerolineaceae bacterium]